MTAADPDPGARELMGAEVLVVDADTSIQRGLIQLLSPTGLHVTTATSHEKALEMCQNKFFGVVVIDLDTPEAGAGADLVKLVRERSPVSLVLVLVAKRTFEGAVAAFRAGAHDVIAKSSDQVDYLKARIVDAVANAKVRRGTERLLSEVMETLEDFLKRFMDAERRSVDLEDRLAGRATDRMYLGEDVRILVVDADERLFIALEQSGAPGFAFVHSPTGGEALDRVTNDSFQIALVGPHLPDLPNSMVTRALKAQAADIIVISYQLGGRLEIVDAQRTIPIVEQFTAASQLSERLDELAEAHRQTGKERRYLAAFRERHYELLRRLAELRRKIEKAIADGKDG